MAPAKDKILWTPDLRLPARGTLQEFVGHEREAALRIDLQIDQRAQLEVNDRVVAETEGFRNAAALAELYTRDYEVLLSDDRSAKRLVPGQGRYYRICRQDGAYKVYADLDPAVFVYEPEKLDPKASRNTLVEAIEAASIDASRPLRPAFANHLEIYEGLNQTGPAGLVVSIWVSRWHMPFVSVLEEQEFAPLSLVVAKGLDGSYYTIYRLVAGSFLTELRSHHQAEEIGRFTSPPEARAYCELFNAARNSSDWVSFSHAVTEDAPGRKDNYLLAKEGRDFALYLAEPEKTLLGRFGVARLAEAYATVHRDATNHFSLGAA